MAKKNSRTSADRGGRSAQDETGLVQTYLVSDLGEHESVEQRPLQTEAERRRLVLLLHAGRLAPGLDGLERNAALALVRFLLQAGHDSGFELLPQAGDRNKGVRADLGKDFEHLCDLGTEVDPRRLPQTDPLCRQPFQAVCQRKVGDVLEPLGEAAPRVHRSRRPQRVVIRDHYPFGVARCARCIDDRRVVIGPESAPVILERRPPASQPCAPGSTQSRVGKITSTEGFQRSL